MRFYGGKPLPNYEKKKKQYEDGIKQKREILNCET